MKMLTEIYYEEYTLEHPEDSILSGDLTVLDWFTSIDNDISAKIDEPLLLCGELNQKLVILCWN